MTVKPSGRNVVWFVTILLPIGILVPLAMWLPFWLTNHDDILLILPISAGMIIQLCTSLFLSYCQIEPKARIIVNLLDRKEFITRIKNAAEIVGYNLHDESETMLAFEPAGQDGMSENAILVRVGEEKAEITGPIWITYKLRKRMEFLFENALLIR